MVALNQPPQEPSEESHAKVMAVLNAIKDTFNVSTKVHGLTRKECRDALIGMQNVARLAQERIDEEDEGEQCQCHQ